LYGARWPDPGKLQAGYPIIPLPSFLSQFPSHGGVAGECLWGGFVSSYCRIQITLHKRGMKETQPRTNSQIKIRGFAIFFITTGEALRIRPQKSLLFENYFDSSKYFSPIYCN
jgi:hypothetical protein